MSEKLWFPEKGLDRARSGGVGYHHVLVRKPSVNSVKESIRLASHAAYTRGYAGLSEDANVHAYWNGDLFQHPSALSPTQATLYLLEATVTCNQAISALSMLQLDGITLSTIEKEGVIPVLIVTELSYTRAWKDDEDVGKKIDPDYYDPDGPEKVQAACQALGVAVIRTQQKDLSSTLRRVIPNIYVGEADGLLIP